MKATPTTVAGLALFFGLASAQSGYDSTCNPPPVGEQDVDPVNEPGIVATYGCGQIHRASDYAQESRGAATPRDCAIECSKRIPEGPCSWHSGTCYFYNPGANDDAWSGAVTVTIRKDYDKIRAAHDACVQSQQNAPGGGGPPGGGGSPGSSLDGGPCIDGERFMVNGKEFEMRCSRSSADGAVLTSRGGNAVTTQSRKECIEHCANSPDCKFALFTKANDGTGECHGRWFSNSRTITTATKFNADWDIAFRV